MSTTKLTDVLKSIQWTQNIDSFLSQSDLTEKMNQACIRIAVWSKQLENLESGNAAISFVRALQISTHQAVATSSLGIYKASASAIRGIVENALYYTYFRSHPVELASLIREKTYYVSKSEILTFHKVHTPNFREFQDNIGLVGRIETWYSTISSIVHGQIPGTWVEQKNLIDTKTNVQTLKLVVNEFCEAEDIVHDLFLLTIGIEKWDDFSHTAKKILLNGQSGEKKTMLGLDRK